MQIPTIPAFSTGESGSTQLSHLIQLSQAVGFMCIIGNMPIWRFYANSATSLTASNWTSVPTTVVTIDSDGCYYTGGMAQIQTQGYYDLMGCVPFQGGTTANNNAQVAFLITGGGNNPHLSLGSTIMCGGGSSSNFSTAGIDCVVCENDICPICLYPGDTVILRVWSYVATSTDVMTNNAATSTWFPVQFAGRWVRTGT